MNLNDIPQILTSLEQVPAILEALVGSVSPARLKERRREGAWTIAEHAIHLAEAQNRLTGRIQLILAEDNPEIVPYLPDPKAPPKPTVTLKEALPVFAAERAKQMGILRGLAPADWKRPARHKEYDAYGLHILVRHMLMHDHWHLYRMEELWLTREDFLAA
jgi:hypothetical protein